MYNCSIDIIANVTVCDLQKKDIPEEFGNDTRVVTTEPSFLGELSL